MANVGKNIRNLRTQKKLTQDELAEKLFVSRQTVSNYENGKSNPDIDTLIKIAEIMEVDVNALIYGLPADQTVQKERRRTLVFLVILVCVGILLYRFQAFLRAFGQDTFIMQPLWVTHNVAFPCYYVLAGWTAMQAAGCFLHARPFSGKYVAKIHLAIILILAGGLILLLPGCVQMLAGAFQLHYRLVHKIEGNYSFSYFDLIPLWDDIAGRLFHFLFRIPVFLFFLPGAALWITKPDKSVSRIH